MVCRMSQHETRGSKALSSRTWPLSVTDLPDPASFLVQAFVPHPSAFFPSLNRVYNMSKPFHIPAGPDDDYELRPTDSAPSDPLLPSYSSSLKPAFRHEIERTKRQRNRFRRACAVICVCLGIVIPTLGLISCAWGEGAIKGIRNWDQVPEDWKEWLGGALPDGFGGGKGNPMFPTK